MKKIILSILISLFAFFATAQQGNVTGQRIQANTNLLPPLDTVLAPFRVGEIRTKVSGADTLYFQCVSLSASRKWIYTKMSAIPLSVQKIGDSTIFWIDGTRFAIKDSIDASTSALYQANGDGLLTTFTVTHGFTGTPTNIQVTPAGVDSAIAFYVNNITGTTFDITFATPPIVGTNNVTFYWLAK